MVMPFMSGTEFAAISTDCALLRNSGHAGGEVPGAGKNGSPRRALHHAGEGAIGHAIRDIGTKAGGFEIEP